MIFADCSAIDLNQFPNNVDLSVFRSIKSFPKVEQLESICSKFDEGQKLAQGISLPLRTKGSRRQIIPQKVGKLIKTPLKALNKICKEYLLVIKSANVACNKTVVVVLKTQNCVDTGSYDSKSENTLRLEKEKMCIQKLLSKYCPPKWATNLSSAFFELKSILQIFNGSPSGFQINLWISMFMATVLVFLL